MKSIRRGLSLAWIGTLILGMALTACSPGGTSSGDEIMYYEETKVLTEEETENIVEVTENSTRILFRETTPFVASIEPGDVLVCEYPILGAEYGFLGQVIAVSSMEYNFLEGVTGLTNGGTVVEIEPATLEDVIEQGAVSVNATIPREDLLNDAMWTTGVEVLQADGGYQFSYSPAEGVTIEGHLLVTADTEIYIEVGFFSGLEEFEFIFSPGLEMGVTLTVEESVSWEEKYTIAEIPGPPIPIWGPVTITPSIELVVGTGGTVTASIETSVTYERIYDVGIRYYNGTWSTTSEVRGEGATLEPPSFSGQAEARVYAGAVLSGTVGVSYVAEAALRTELLGNFQASGEIETPPWRWKYDLELYLSAQVVADLSLCRIAHVRWESDPWEYPDPPYNLAYGASGRVTTEGGQGLDGVQINFSGGYSSVTSDIDGYWRKHLLNGDVEATPGKAGYVFDPSSITITGAASTLDFQAFEEEESINFPDPNLEAAIRETIGKPTGPIYRSDLEGLQVLDGWERNIADLTGLEYCTSLIGLYLWNNQISDISPLANLTNLVSLFLNDNQLSDIDIALIANLTNLQGLNLAGNQISDISPLANLTKLEGLSIQGNQISDISPLANLTSLYSLNLDDNQISDISPLANLTNLDMLHLGFNQISDISLLANLTNLIGLDLYYNQISDISPLSNLSNLTELFIQGNQISDISPLANLTNLDMLILGFNQISDISPLANLTNLTDLDLWNNQISDISPLVSNPGLGQGDAVSLVNNPLSSDSINIYIPQLEARGVTVSWW